MLFKSYNLSFTIKYSNGSIWDPNLHHQIESTWNLTRVWYKRRLKTGDIYHNILPYSFQEQKASASMPLTLQTKIPLRAYFVCEEYPFWVQKLLARRKKQCETCTKGSRVRWRALKNCFSLTCLDKGVFQAYSIRKYTRD